MNKKAITGFEKKTGRCITWIKKVLKTGLFLIITIFFLNSCNKKHPSYQAIKIDIAPVIDGKIDTIWATVHREILKRKNLGGQYIEDSIDLSANFRMAWDDNYLYVLVDVDDDKKYDVTKFKYQVDIPSGYNCDCIELFFDMKNDKDNKYGSFNARDDDYRFEFVYNQDIVTGTYKSAKGIEFAQRDKLGGYIIEIKLPFETLGFKPREDDIFGCEVSVDDNDDTPNQPIYNMDKRAIISWSQKEGADGWSKTGVYGNVTLVNPMK